MTRSPAGYGFAVAGVCAEAITRAGASAGIPALPKELACVAKSG
jgi:hypothetical protein